MHIHIYAYIYERDLEGSSTEPQWVSLGKVEFGADFFLVLFVYISNVFTISMCCLSIMKINNQNYF